MSFYSGESFFDAQPMFICEQVSLKILDINNAATKLTGYPKQYFLNKLLLKIGEFRNAEELGICGSEVVNEEFSRIWQIDSKEGNELFFQLSAHLINFKGKPAKLIVAHNISEKINNKNKRKKLLSSQINIKNSPLAEIEWDTSLNIISWSEKAEDLFGYSVEEAIAKPKLLKEFIHPEDISKVQNNLEQAYKEKKQNVSVINRNITKDGKVIYCQWYNSLLYNADGEVEAIYSLTHDVTPRQEALMHAKRSLKSYQDLFNTISDAIYIVNDHGKIVEANYGVFDTFGYKPDEVVGKSMKILTAPGKYDEDRIKEILIQAKNGNSSKYEGWGRKKNGEIIATEFLVNTGNYFGNEVYIVIERDISDRRKSEEELKQREGLLTKLFNSSPMGIALLNEHHEVEMVNDGFEQLFGYRENELRGLKLDKIIVPEKGKLQAEKLTQSDHVREATVKRIRKDGKILDVIIYAVPVIVEKRVVAIYGIYVDITDSKKAEEKVRKSLREKEMLLAEVHHRVKNNLAVITGLLELQSFSAEEESAKRILRESQMRVQSIAMVHEKLYQTEDFSKVDISQYLKELSEVIHKTMRKQERKVKIKLDITPVKLPITKAIPCGLLLNEILTNSFKHAFKGKERGEIKVRLTKVKDELLFVLNDDGVGLPENSEMDINKSMGMTLIRTLAKQLNADFKYRNEPGAYFEFRFEKV